MELNRRPLLTVAEAAKILGVNAKVLNRWIGKRIRGVNLGDAGKRKSWRIDPDELDLYIKHRSTLVV